MREQGYEIQQLRVFVVVLAVFLLPLWIIALFGLFRRNVTRPVPVVPLAPHEVELLIRRIEDEIGSQASVPSVVVGIESQRPVIKRDPCKMACL